jgi:hypothetical protein
MNYRCLFQSPTIAPCLQDYRRGWGSGQLQNTKMSRTLLWHLKNEMRQPPAMRVSSGSRKDQQENRGCAWSDIDYTKKSRGISNRGVSKQLSLDRCQKTSPQVVSAPHLVVGKRLPNVGPQAPNHGGEKHRLCVRTRERIQTANTY